MKIIVTNKTLWRIFSITVFFLNTVILSAQTTYRSYVPPNSGESTDRMILSDYKSLFSLDADMEQGIIGNISGNGSIKVNVYSYDATASNKKGIRIYNAYIDQSQADFGSFKTNYAGVLIYNKQSGTYSSLGSGLNERSDIKVQAQNAKLHYPGLDPANPKLWIELFGFPVSYPDIPPPVFQPVIIEIILTGNATLTKAKIPSIGIVGIENGVVTRLGDVDLAEKCASEPNSDPLCPLINRLRTPNTSIPSGSEDLVIAAHRGWWGYDSGPGVPVENSIDAINKSHDDEQIDFVEMDVTTTSDKTLIFMHDYVLSRLTDYPGDAFSFQLPWSTIKNYNAKQRDGTVVNNKPLSKYKDALPVVKAKHMMMMIDIKELQSNGQDPHCKANCDYQSKEKQKESWAEITKQAIKEARDVGANKNIIVKTYYPPSDIYRLLGDDLMDEVLWIPMLVPNNFKNSSGQVDINLLTAFVDQWNLPHNRGLIACYETDFFSPTSVMLQTFRKGGVTYENLLDYIYKTTGRRSGIFSEEPVGPKGDVNRWGKWKIKNTSTDIRGDFFRLKDVPYGKYMLITTDRLDVWKEIKSKY